MKYNMFFFDFFQSIHFMLDTFTPTPAYEVKTYFPKTLTPTLSQGERGSFDLKS
jgi:hypothetical protein